MTTTPCPCGYTLTAHVHWTPQPAILDGWDLPVTDAGRETLVAALGTVR